MAQVAAGCRQWIVFISLIFLCFLGANCIINEENQVVFSQPEYVFAEDFSLPDGGEPLPNPVNICYTYTVFVEVELVNIQSFTTEGTAIGNHCYDLEIGILCYSSLTIEFFAAGDEDFIPLSSNITQPVNRDEMCVTITLLGDTIFEDDEQFTFTIVVNDLGASNENFSSSVTITIQDNDGT